jgi:hypothetical protein
VNRTRTIAFLVPDRKRVGGVDRTVRTRDTEGVVVQSFTDDGTRSIRNVADILNQSKNTVQNILKGNHMHPNHYNKVQRLLSEDYAPRRLCNSRNTKRIQAFFANVNHIESYFCHKGTFNSHNLHVWSGENPQFEHLL